MWEADKSFGDLIFKFRIDLIENSSDFPVEMSVLQVLREWEKTSSKVRHYFVDIDSEEGASAAYRLLQFCSLAGIKFDEELTAIRSNLGLWENQRPVEGESESLKELNVKLTESLKRNTEILNELEQLKKYRLEAELFSRRIRLLESEIRMLRNQDNKNSVDKLENEKAEAADKKKKADQKIEGLNDASEYLESLTRISSYTRTRFDFERDITKLTPEQQAVLDHISLTGDFLVKGGAGTGKTLVLIKALAKALSIDESELSFSGRKTSVKLLTYSRTLAKYDRYLASVLKQDTGADIISTVDKFLYDRLRMIDPDYRIIYSDSYAAELLSSAGFEGSIDTAGLAGIIEGEIFALDSDRDSFKTSDEVWKARDLLVKKMHHDKSFTKNYSRRLILDYIADNPNDEHLKDTDFIFVDEIQDLTAVDIKAVKACSRRAVIMAGDSDQSIYQSGFSFARGGIDIRGTTRILKTDFRNTVEIHRLAESYRMSADGADKDTSPTAFRTGPPPELYTAGDREDLETMMVQRIRLFTEDLGYAPENICVLVPSGRDIEPLRMRFTAEEWDSCDLRDNDFSFTDRDVIRISTMHSSKGLDSPVVLLMLDKLPRTAPQKTAEALEKMRRNLIYVSMTRAMDQLNVFTMAEASSPEIRDLIRAFNKLIS